MGAPPPHGQAQEAGGESGNFRPAGCTVCPYLLPFTLLQVRQGIFAILDAFPALDLPRSFSVTRSRWGADPLCRGSYSYVTPGTSGDDVEALSAPLVGPRLTYTLWHAHVPLLSSGLQSMPATLRY